MQEIFCYKLRTLSDIIGLYHFERASGCFTLEGFYNTILMAEISVERLVRCYDFVLIG